MFRKNPGRVILLCLLFLPGRPAQAQYYVHHWSTYDASYINWLMYQRTKASGGNLIRWWRSESTIGTVFSSGFSRQYQTQTNIGGGPYRDTVFHERGVPQAGVHCSSNSNYMIKRLDRNSILSFSVGAEMDYLRWKVNKPGIPGAPDETEGAMQVGIPVTIDYKYGCDVDFDPELKMCYAFGGGAMPMLFAGYMDGADDGRYRVVPYLYASFGFYAGGCWKIRATFMPGQLAFYDSYWKDQPSGDFLDLGKKTMFMIGISHMTYSSDWGEGQGVRSGGSRYRRGGRRHRW